MSQTYVIWSIHVMCSLHFVCCVLVCCRKVIRVVCWIMRLHFVMFYNIILFMYFSVLIFLEFVCTVLLSRNVAIWAVLLTLPYKQEDRLAIKIKFNHLLIHKMSYNKSCIFIKKSVSMYVSVCFCFSSVVCVDAYHWLWFVTGFLLA